MKPIVIVMMVTVCLRLKTVCVILRVMTRPFKCKTTLHVVACMLFYPFIFLAMIQRFRIAAPVARL